MADALPPEYQAQMAQMLAQMAQQQRSPAQVATPRGPIAVRQSPYEALAQGLSSAMALYAQNKAAQKQAEVREQAESDMLKERGELAGLPAEELLARAMASRFPQNQKYGEGMAKVYEFQSKQKDREADNARQAAQQKMMEQYYENMAKHWAAQEKEAVRRGDLAAAQEAQQARNDAVRLGLEARKVAALEQATDFKTSGKGSGGSAKPMPPSAVKLQQEELDVLGLTKNLNALLEKHAGSVERGSLQLGPAQNLMSRGKNLLGMSDANSRNFANFRADMEKMRNDSLRLNKGTQTEGDAVRAWNELFENMNDPKVVAARLRSIQQMNRAAAKIKEANIQVLRENWGQEPLDLTPYQEEAAPARPSADGGTTPQLPSADAIAAEIARRRNKGR